MAYDAVLWDFDGTLADTARKNMRVTYELLRNYISDIDENPPEILTSYANYQKANYLYKSWQELYKYGYGLNEEQTISAGKLWTAYQKADKSFPEIYSGLDKVCLSVKTAMGICSQNSAETIISILSHYGINQCFGAVIGHEDIPSNRQKPDPAGFLKCLKALNKDDRENFIYIGDHREDVVFAKNACSEMRKCGVSANVTSITVSFMQTSFDEPKNWELKPDYHAKSPAELGLILKKLGVCD